MGYETEAWRAPTVGESETILASEHGRITHNIDYRSHWFILTRAEMGRYYLLVKHGGGEERIALPSVNFKITANMIASLDSDVRYLMLHHLYGIHRDARRAAEDKTAGEYRLAFAEGRLKKRKLPKRGIKVWTEPKIASATVAV